MATTKKKTTKKKAIKKTATTKARKPEFEQALEQEAAAAQAREEKEKQEAGRADQPADQGEVQIIQDISEKQIKACGMVLKVPFGVWSNIKKIPEIRLSTKEAEEWAVPFIDLLEYYFPAKVPEIVWIWFCFLSATAKVIDSRIEIIHKHEKAVVSAAPQPMGPAGSSLSADQPAPKHNGAEPATEYPQE